MIIVVHVGGEGLEGRGREGGSRVPRAHSAQMHCHADEAKNGEAIFFRFLFPLCRASCPKRLQRRKTVDMFAAPLHAPHRDSSFLSSVLLCAPFPFDIFRCLFLYFYIYILGQQSVRTPL